MAQSRRSKTYERREGQKPRTKYSQLWHDQLGDMKPVARDLQDAKTTPNTPRITENTLIRVSVDVLLEYAEYLTGDTEEEIRTNVLAALRKSP